MKVIKKGRPQKGWAEEFKCTGNGNGNGGCSAMLLVEEGDLYHTYSSHYDGSSETYTTFRCVECGVQTDVKVPGKLNVRVKESTRKCSVCSKPQFHTRSGWVCENGHGGAPPKEESS